MGLKNDLKKFYKREPALAIIAGAWVGLNLTVGYLYGYGAATWFNMQEANV